MGAWAGSAAGGVWRRETGEVMRMLVALPARLKWNLLWTAGGHMTWPELGCRKMLPRAGLELGWEWESEKDSR